MTGTHPARAAAPLWSGKPGPTLQPNEFDLRRIARALTRRVRYRYVAPQVRPCGHGYRIESPCCSRKVDAGGGMIDIARIEFDEQQGQWMLYRKLHASGQWLLHTQAARLSAVLDCLSADAGQQFWP